MTSATRCLAISEIQRNILRSVRDKSDDSESPTHRRTAYNVALTCKALSETALDELWTVIGSLRPLLNLFPDDVIAKSTQQNGHCHFVSLCLWTAQSCLHLLLCEGSSPSSVASRLGGIQEICLSNPRALRAYVELCRAELSILGALSVLQLKPFMAPQLRVLHWSGAHLLYANLFVGPCLQDLKLYTSGDEDGDAAAVLANVINSSPAMKNISVSNILGQNTSRTLATLDSTSWSKLTSLDLETDTSPEFVPALGRLPVLDSLRINFGRSSRYPSFKVPPPEPLFPRLTQLDAFAVDFASIPTRLLFGAENAPQLADLTLIAEDHVPTAAAVRECFAILSSPGDRPALTSVNVLVPGFQPSPDMLDSKATLDTIRPLFALHGLDFLAVSLPFALDDTALLSITEAWPSITGLHLGGRGQPYHETNVTLHGLVQFIADTRRLEYLTLTFDASDVATALDDCEDIDVDRRSLELWPGASRILDASAVAEFWNEVLPGVRMVEDDGGALEEREDPEGFGYRKKWKRVDTLRGTYAAADAT